MAIELLVRITSPGCNITEGYLNWFKQYFIDTVVLCFDGKVT